MAKGAVSGAGLSGAGQARNAFGSPLAAGRNMTAAAAGPAFA